MHLRSSVVVFTVTLIALALVASSTPTIAGSHSEIVMQPPADPVAFTMTRMRLASTLLQDTQRQSGAYPLADRKVHLLAEVVAGASFGSGPRAWRDGWGRPLLYRARRDVQEVISCGSDGVADVDYDAALLYPGRYWQRRYGRKSTNGVLSGRDPAVLPGCE
jgi:hypothetical protein